MLNSVLIFLDISGGELMVIALVALLVLGPQKMGDFARKAGKMMNEVKRVSSDFTSQLSEETNGLQSEVRSIRDTLKDAANNIKDEFNKQQQDVSKSLDTDIPQDIDTPQQSLPEVPVYNPIGEYNINEPSNDVFNLSQDSSVIKPQPESAVEDISSEHSGTQHVSIEEQVDKDSTPKQENTTNP